MAKQDISIKVSLKTVNNGVVCWNFNFPFRWFTYEGEWKNVKFYGKWIYTGTFTWSEWLQPKSQGGIWKNGNLQD